MKRLLVMGATGNVGPIKNGVLFYPGMPGHDEGHGRGEKARLLEALGQISGQGY